MDVGGSFLELSCVRVALIPAGPPLSDYRFEQLASHLIAFREIPITALPRRAAVPRATGSATFSSMPTALRDSLSDSPSPLSRSLSATREAGPKRNSLEAFSRQSNIDHLPIQTRSASCTPPGAKSSLSVNSLTYSIVGSTHGARGRTEVASLSSPTPSASPKCEALNKTSATSPHQMADLNMYGPEVLSSFRLRYDVIHRDRTGALHVKPFSEWDDFHSSKIWGVFGIVDHTHLHSADHAKQTMDDIYDEFNSSLTHFKDATVRRLIIFTSPEDPQVSGPLVQHGPLTSESFKSSGLPFSVGYIPERLEPEDTRLEVRAQIVHFSGLLLNSIDRDCWKRRESPPTELFLSPIDGKQTTDRQSKLVKRRAGRLDKLLGDSLLLMGCPSEALVKYTSAIERAKASSDRLWHAGAMEGWSAAHVLNYVGSGGAVDDSDLSDLLIEHYSEVYKLYHKKGVAEPEAAAAMRLAEFLGWWTNRRKDALEAAEHAATVGESLKVPKRAALWEALARFSDRMGCRRKAALFLYRLGNLNSSLCIWSSAVTLMIASERQLSLDGRKPWASLNRKVLLTAANLAKEAGDTNTAARLHTEALIISVPEISGNNKGGGDDEVIIAALNKAQVPAYLPAASGVIDVEEMTPLQIPGLSLRQLEIGIGDTQSDSLSTDGPFIYNPFEAKKRAKAAAVARRTVSWVCGEQAQVSVRLHSNVKADIVIDVISVLLAQSASECHEFGNVHDQELSGSPPNEQGSVAVNDSASSEEHTKKVRDVLRRSSELAKTISETVTIFSGEKKREVVKCFTIFPKQVGPLFVRGLLIRLFNGALVMLPSDSSEFEANPPVNVICNLPRISISCHSVEGESMDNISKRTPLTVFDGEQRSFRVDIKNIGADTMTWMAANVLSSHPERLEVIKHDFSGKGILNGLEQSGGSKSFMIHVLGKHRMNCIGRNSPLVDTSEWGNSSSTVSVIVEYEGKDSSGMLRESSTSVKVVSKRAVTVGRVTIFENYPSDSSQSEPGGDLKSSCCVAFEVTNEVSAPATVVMRQQSEFWKSAEYGVKESHRQHELKDFSNEGCLVECGASVRLVCILETDVMRELRKRLNGDVDNYDISNIGESPVVFKIMWSLPSLGRQGFLDISVRELWQAMVFSGNVPSGNIMESNCFHGFKYQTVQAEVTMKLLNSKHRESSSTCKQKAEDDGCVNFVEVGTFWTVLVQVRNKCDVGLPKESMLDLELIQKDDRGVSRKLQRAFIVGAVERVFVGSLKPTLGTFAHKIRVRVSSTGTFQLIARLYDGVRRSSRVSPASCPKSKSQWLHTSNEFRKFTLEESFPFTLKGLEGKSEKLVKVGSVAPEEDGVSPNNGSPISASMEAEQSPRTPTLAEESMSNGFKSARVSRKRGQGEGSPTANIIHPSTIDTYPSSQAGQNKCTALACSILLFAAIQDSEGSNVSLQQFSSSESQSSLTPRGETPIMSTSISDADTLYHL